MLKLLKQAQLAIPDLQNLLDEEAVDHLALICKTRGHTAKGGFAVLKACQTHKALDPKAT